MLQKYITQCQQILAQNNTQSPIEKLILACENTLNPNDYALSFFENLKTQSKEAMQIAIVGQFSSGKSTFLNALLGQDILPTGATPITSKVCKICYGEDYILEIHYKDGRKILQNVNFLQELTREKSQNIDHFCLYVPLLLLKEINFLDTPGFNSQNEEDTFTTQKILENVDGIIWLTLIDNAGKKSETNLLKAMMKHYSQKSLCVLNQKDRLKNEEEVQTSLEYAKNAFSGIFAEVIPISAKTALKARLNTAQQILALSLNHFAQELQEFSRQEDLQIRYNTSWLDNLHQQTKEHISQEQKRLESSKSSYEQLMQDSNMPAIFEFLKTTIKPQSKIAKQFSIARKLREQHILLHYQYHKILLCYKKLKAILKLHQEKTTTLCYQAQEKEQKVFNDLYIGLDSLLDSLSQKIYNSLTKKSLTFSVQDKGLLGRVKLNNHTSEVTLLNLDQLRLELQNPDTQLVKNFRSLSVQIKNFCEAFLSGIEKFSQNLTSEILEWKTKEIQKQELYKYAPQNQSLKELENFAQKSYENLLIDFYKNDLMATSFLQSELNFLSQFISTNYNNALDLALNKLDSKIQYALKKHQENPLEFALFNPTLENIRDFLNEAFCFEQFQARLFGPMNLLKKTYSQFLHQLEKITTNKIQFVMQNTLAPQQEIHKIQASLGEIKAFLQKIGTNLA